MSELRTRDGDQALPKATDGPGIQAIVISELGMLRAALFTPRRVQDHLAALIQDVADRRELGIRRYGQPLQAFNGRDVLRDILDETVDRLVYVRQAMVEGFDDLHAMYDRTIQDAVEVLEAMHRRDAQDGAAEAMRARPEGGT